MQNACWWFGRFDAFREFGTERAVDIPCISSSISWQQSNNKSAVCCQSLGGLQLLVSYGVSAVAIINSPWMSCKLVCWWPFNRVMT